MAAKKRTRTSTTSTSFEGANAAEQLDVLLAHLRTGPRRTGPGSLGYSVASGGVGVTTTPQLLPFRRDF